MPRGRHKDKTPKDPKDWLQQANRMLGGRYLELGSRHAAKQAAGLKGNASTGKIHSMGTFRKYETCLKNAGQWINKRFGVARLDAVTKDQANAYLDHRRQEVGQKQLDADRLAMRFLKNVGKIEKIHSDRPTIRKGRAYTRRQVALIASRQRPHNALATHIAHQAGLRAHELHTLRRADEAAPSHHREWRSDRFAGRIGERYLVTGKGGLTREVLIPHKLARALEERRLDQPNTAIDRQIHYEGRRYHIGGGNAWSKSVTIAAQTELKWSTGAHGVRHSYAQERIQELQDVGYDYKQAKLVLSQELGHFREDVVNAYLR